MSDADLAAIRQARLQQLQTSQGGRAGGGQEDEQRSREAEARASILAQILEPAAADRLGRIRMVHAQRADDVEARLVGLGRSGQLRARVTDEQLREMLGAIAEQERKSSGFGGAGGGSGSAGGESAGGVSVVRRKGGWDEDDLDDLLRED